MSDQRYLIQTHDSLVLRDGKPFGAEKNWGASAYNWIQPQTLTGMVRTALGFSQSLDFFNSKENQQAILKVGIKNILTGIVHDNQLKYLAIPPADVIFTTDKDGAKLNPHYLTFSSLGANEGTDIINRDWLIPSLNTLEKPAKKVPAFWFWSKWLDYILKGPQAIASSIFKELGISSPIFQERVHNALSSETHTTETGRLFANKDLYFYSADQKPHKLYLSFEVTGIQKDMTQDLSGDCYLGGDRKTVQLTKASLDFPTFSEGKTWANQKYLKLILMTNGNFGSWCPEWLKPDLNALTIPFVKIPGTEYSIRLRSACVTGWDGVSGWDSVKRAPKALKKLVKAGSVYLIELQNPNESEAIAQKLWGSTLGNAVEDKEGYGLIFPAVALNQIQE